MNQAARLIDKDMPNRLVPSQAGDNSSAKWVSIRGGALLGQERESLARNDYSAYIARNPKAWQATTEEMHAPCSCLIISATKNWLT